MSVRLYSFYRLSITLLFSLKITNKVIHKNTMPNIDLRIISLMEPTYPITLKFPKVLVIKV